MATSELNNPYEQIWKTRDLRALETPVELDNKRPEWERGLSAFGKEMQATGYGLVALGSQGVENVIGENEVTSGITDWGLKGYDKSINESQSGLNAPSVARIEDIKNVSDATDWASYQLGKGLPMLGSLALSGGVGGAVARLGANAGIKALAKSAVGNAVEKAVATKAVQAAKGQIVTQAMKQAAAKSLQDTFTKGAIAGGFAGSFGLEGGLAFGEQAAAGVNPADAVKSAIAVGGINGALEFLPFYKVAKDIGMGSYAKKAIADVITENPELSKRAIALAKEIGGRAAKGAAEGTVAEGVTEGLQELVSIAGLRWAENEPLFADLTPDDWSRVKNAAVTGALVGGVAAGAGATLAGPESESGKSTGKPTVKPGIEATPEEQTRTQVLEAMRGKVDASLTEAQASGDTAKIEELQRIKKLYDKELGIKTETPIVETAPVETPPVEQAPVEAAPVEAPPVETAPQTILPPSQNALPVTRTVPPTQETIPPVQETPLNIPPVPPVTEQAPVVNPQVPPVVNPPVTTAQGIAAGFNALGSGIDTAARQKARDNLLNGTPQIFKKPAAIAAAKANPAYNVEDLSDGSARVVGVLDPDTNTWVGKQPTVQPTQQPASQPTAQPIQQQAQKLITESLQQPIDNVLRQEEEKLKQLAQDNSVEGTDKQALLDQIANEEQMLAKLAQDAALPTQELNQEITPPEQDVTPGINNLVGQNTPLPTQEPAQDVTPKDVILSETPQSASTGKWTVTQSTPGKVIVKSPKINGAELTGEFDAGGETPESIAKSFDTRVSPPALAELQFDLKVLTDTDIENKWGLAIKNAVDTLTAKGTSIKDAPLQWWIDTADLAYDQPNNLLAQHINAGTAVPEELGGKVAEDLVKNQGYSPNTVESLVKMVPPGWKLVGIFDQDPINTPIWENAKGTTIALSDGKFITASTEDNTVNIFDNHEQLTNWFNTQEKSAGTDVINPKDVEGFPSPPKTSLQEVTNEIDKALADGKDFNKLVAISNSFGIGTDNSKWDIKYGKGVITLKSKLSPEVQAKGGIEGQWTVVWDGGDNVSINQVINGKLYKEGINVQLANWLATTLNKVDSWVFAELKGDIDCNTPIGAIATVWGTDIGIAAQHYKNKTISTLGLISALANSPAVDMVTGKVLSPFGLGKLESYIKENKTPSSDFGGYAAKLLVKVNKYSPNTIEFFADKAPPGWVLEDIITEMGSDGFYPEYKSINSLDTLMVKLDSAGDMIITLSQLGGVKEFKSYSDLMDYLQHGINPPVSASSVPDITHESSSTQQSSPPVVSMGEWTPVEMPNGYELSSFDNVIMPLDGTNLDATGFIHKKEKIEVAHIHNYLKHVQLPPHEKIELFKEIPKNSSELSAFKANHPYLFRKVSIDEATSLDHGKTLLNEILVRRDKYTFDEILEQSVKFKDKFGDEEFINALASAPKEIVQPPHLDGWLTNMRAEEDLLNENPFEGVWADYSINSTQQPDGTTTEAARYGVIIINPKTGKVLLRKVSNQFEGITWDFARGGADRFSSPTAKPHLIDTWKFSKTSSSSNRYMEHPLIAAKREAKEEFGYDAKIIGQLAKGFFTDKGSMASLYYIGVPTSEQTDEHLNPTHGVKETDETRWVDLHEARRLLTTMPTLELDPTMKRDGHHKPRIARIARTLEAVFNPAMQKSDLDYRGSTKAMELYFADGFYTEFPKALPASAKNKSFDSLTESQKIQVAAGLYVSKRYPNADSNTKIELQRELVKKRKAALQAWVKSKLGKGGFTSIIEGNAQIGTIQDELNKTGGKIVLSLWHGSNKTSEAIIDDIINPLYLGSGWGGNDTKDGMFLTDSKSKAKKWGYKAQVNMLVAFNNLKVIAGTTNYDQLNFTSIINDAKANGYDGVLFNNVVDTIEGRQVVVWNADNITAGSGVGVGFTGKNLYQSGGELGESIDVDTAKVVLSDTFGATAQKMLDSGLLELVESGGPDGIAGQYFGEEQKIRVYLDYVSSPRELIGAVLHEGSHAGVQEILGKSAEFYHRELLQENKPLSQSAIYKTAWEGAKRFGIENTLTPENTAEIDRVRAELKKIDPFILIEEDLANFVQMANPSSSLWQKIVNAIKVWWAKSAVGQALKERGIGFELTEEMLVGLVTAALRTQSTRRGSDYATYVVHASGNDWTASAKYPYGRPDLKFVLASGGEGYINYGWGFYVAESYAAFNHYKNSIGNKTYGLHLPDDIPPRMIEWDRSLSQQSSIVQDAITSSRDNYFLLRMAVKSKNRKTSYPAGSPNLETYGTGGALYNEIRDYFIKTKFNGDSYGLYNDPETHKSQTNKNIARRYASRKLAEYGISGVRLLDAGSRVVKITKQPDNKYKLVKGEGSSSVTEVLTEKEFEKHVGPDLANKAKSQPVGKEESHAGFGYYNWVFWRQSDLDRFKVVYKNGNQVAEKPKENASYDPNGIGIPYAEHPGFSDYVINPKTGEAAFSKSEQTFEVDLETLRSSIDSVMGEGWLKQAESAGVVEIVEGVGPNGESGSWVGDKIRLYTGSMPVGGSPIGVLLHEGKHATFAELLGNTLTDYTNDLRALANSGNQTARNAIIHATVAAADILGIKHGFNEGGTKADLDAVRALIEERKPGLLAEEELAYFVQYGTENQSGIGFLHRLVNQIKAWFAKTKLGQRLKEAGLGFELTEGMAVEWAKMGLHESLSKARQSERTRAQILYEATRMSPSQRLGKALENTNELYSMGAQEFRDMLWTDPTDSRQEFVNKPGLLQKFRSNFVDFYAEIEKKSKDIYDEYSLLRNKKSARLAQARQKYMLPLRELIANSPWTAQEVGDMLAARHIKLDNVNMNLAERASDSYAKKLTAVLSKGKQKELLEARKNVKKGKMLDGTEYVDDNGNTATMSAATKRKLMFDLVNKYAQFEPLNPDGQRTISMEWELFKDAAGGFSNGGVGKSKVRTVDDILKGTAKDQVRFDKITNLFDGMNRHSLQILEDGGLITSQEHARLLVDKSAYAPLRRESYNVDREIEQLFQRAGQGGSKQISTRTGTTALSEPTLVLQNSLAALEASAAAAERNLANTELYKVIKADKAGWKNWFSVVDADKYTTHDGDGFLQSKRATALNKADITLIYKGKKLIIRPNMHNERAVGFVRAVNNLDAQTLNGPMSVLNWVNGIVRWVNVTASPVFLMMNAIRDPFTAAYNMQASEAAPYTKEIFENYGKSFKALKKVFMDGNRDQTDADVRMIERWENAGGRISFIEALKESDDTWRSFDAQVARRQGNMKQIMAAKDKWIDGLENFNILFENVMRLSTFNVLVDKNISEKRAARVSQDLTTNFTRRGFKTQALGVWWLFFNATVQGNYQVLRNMLASKRLQILAGGTIALALTLDLFGRAVADDWDEIPEWDKERFIILPIKVGGDFVKIPAPWVYNTLWRMGGMLGETLSGKRTAQDMVLDTAAMTTTTFSPVQAGSLPQLLSPTAFDPFMQIIENKDFAGNPLGPEGFPGASKKANSEMIWSNTPKGYQSVSRFVNEFTGGSAVESGMLDLRPADYQVLARFLTGSLGRFLSDTTFGLKENIEKGIEGPKDIPIVKELFSDPYNPLRSQTYHNNIASVYGAYKLEKMYKEGPERDLIKLHEVRRERATDLRLYNQAQDVERQLKSLRVRIRAAENRNDSARVKELRGRIEQVQERFNTAYKQ